MKLSAAILTSVGVVLLALGTAAASQEIGAGLSTLQVGYEIYQVRPGDTIENIATRYGVTPESLRSVNGLSASAEVAPGQSLAVVMPNKPQIVVPKQQQAAAAPTNQDPEANGDLGEGPLAVRYALTTRECIITSAIPPAQGRPLYQCEKGTRLVVSARQGDYLGIVMADGSTGWAPASALDVTNETISADELLRLLEGGTTGGRADVVQEAYKYLGTPYRYGGHLPESLDCSLLIQTVFAARGVRLPRTAAAQCEVGAAVNSTDLQPGDRLYFINNAGRIGHTAIYVGNGQFIHASARRGAVGVDSLSDAFYRSRFYAARR